MTVTRGFVIIILSGIAFAVGGGLMGYALGVAVPAYYRGIFSTGQDPGFDPAAVGAALGVSQGLVCGIVVGAVVVLAVAWYNSRRGPFEEDGPPDETPPPTGPAEWPS